MQGQQLVARIKRSSKYWGQTPPNQWFDVRMVTGDYYQLRGNNNNYRVIDVTFGVRVADGTIIDLGNGKLTRPDRKSYREYGQSLALAETPTRGGPTEAHPDAPYCKPDQSCCDFCCGN